MIIKLMRLERKNWAGKAKYDGSTDSIGAFITRPHGLPHTGLTDEDAARLEKTLRMAEGELSPRSDFWTNYSVTIGANEELELDTSEAEDELIYLFLRNHMLVADGYANKRKNQFVQFVLFNPEEKAKEENAKTDNVAHAYSLFYNMSYLEMLDALESTGRKIQSTHPEMVKQQLNTMVTANPDAFVNMLSDKNYQVKLFILKCVSNAVVMKTKNNVDTALFYYGQQFLGTGINEVVNKLQTNDAQGIYIGMKRELDGAIRAKLVDNKAVAPVTSSAPVYNKTEAPKTVATQAPEPTPQPEAYVAPVIEAPVLEPNGKAPLDLAAIAAAQKAAPTRRSKPAKNVVKGAAGLAAKKVETIPQPKPKVAKVKGGNTNDSYDTDTTMM